MIAKNFNISGKIIQSKMILNDQLVILIEDKDSCKIRVIDSNTKKPCIACKMAIPNNKNYLFYIVDEFVVGYNRQERCIDILQLDTCNIEYSNKVFLYHDNITTLIMADNGYFYATGDDLGNVCIWSPKQEKPLYVFTSCHTGKVTDLKFDQDNETLISGGIDTKILVHELSNETKSIELLEHKSGITKVLFCDDKFLTTDLSGNLCMWNKSTNKVLHRITFESPIVDMITSYDKTCVFLLTLDDSIYLINLLAMREDPMLIDEEVTDACSLTFDEQNSKLIVATSQGQIKFYDLDHDNKVIAYTQVHLEKAQDKTPEEEIRPYTFLLVDDSRVMRYTASNCIKADMPDARILEAPDGKDALNLLHEEHIDFILLDWNMPQFTGEEVVKYVRAFEKFNHILIVMATTEGEKEKILKIMKLGANGYIVKPYNKEILSEKINKFIESKK